MTVHFLIPEERHAPLLLDWRTRPDIADKMLSDVAPDLDRHMEWFRRCASRTDYVHRLLCVDGTPVGYVSITITHAAWRIATLGTLVGEDQARTGAAVTFFAYCLNHIFYTLGMRKVVNQILGSNERVWKGQEIIGYRLVGTHRDHVLKNGRAEDLHIYEMARADWTARRRRFGVYEDMDGTVCDEEPDGGSPSTDR